MDSEEATRQALRLAHTLSSWQEVQDDGPYTGLLQAECSCGLLLVAWPGGEMVYGHEGMMSHERYRVIAATGEGDDG